MLSGTHTIAAIQRLTEIGFAAIVRAGAVISNGAGSLGDFIGPPAAVAVLAGKLTGSSIRVPIPNVSMAILHLNLNTAVEKAELNNYLRYMALHSALQ